MRTSFIFVALLCASCAARRPVSQNWRLIQKDSNPVLIPPGIADPGPERRTVLANVNRGEGACPPNVKRRKNGILITIDSDALLKSPPGWLTTWAGDLESQDCIAKGEASKFAERIADSLPLDPGTAFRLLYPNDIVPPVRLQVVSPILRDPDGPVLQVTNVSGDDHSLNLTARSSDNLIGYETALYTVQPKASGPGFNIEPLYADRHIQQATERRAQPATNYFQFPSDAAFYRLFVKSGQNDFTALAIAAPTRMELDRLAAVLASGATCESLTRAKCIAIPRRVALNSVIPVTINGAEVFVRWGADLGEAIRNAGVRQGDSVLGTLAVSRLYRGRATPVEFDHSSPAILRLTLTGGEIISWNCGAANPGCSRFSGGSPAPEKPATSPPQAELPAPQKPPGALIDVGGYRVHLYCTGTGVPTVMIIGGFSFDWALVQPEIAKFSRVCTYDASGTAWSDRGPAPTCRSRVDEIHRLIQNAGVGGPVVLVGFSAGALFARLYARDYPAGVDAMVLIDHAFIPLQRAASPLAPAGPDSPPAVISTTPIDIGAEDAPGFENLPPQIRDLHRWAMSRNPALPNAEMAGTCIAELRNVTLGNLPLMVVSTANDAPGYKELQTSLLALSRNSRQFIADRSFHSIEITQPAAVVDAIREALARTGRSSVVGDTTTEATQQ